MGQTLKDRVAMLDRMKEVLAKLGTVELTIILHAVASAMDKAVVRELKEKEALELALKNKGCVIN